MVIDGHGGEIAAEWVRDHFSHEFKAILAAQPEPEPNVEQALTETFDKVQ